MVRGPLWNAEVCRAVAGGGPHESRELVVLERKEGRGCVFVSLVVRRFPPVPNDPLVGMKGNGGRATQLVFVTVPDEFRTMPTNPTFFFFFLRLTEKKKHSNSE